MMTTPPSLQPWLESWVTSLGIADKPRLEPLAGDGSARPFFRLHTSRGTYVVLHESAWILSKDYAAHQECLKKRGLPVPEFLKVDSQAGVLVMQDLGDELLQKRILANPQRKEEWLTRAVELLADFHGKTYPVPRDLPGFQRRFDTTKLFEELLFTFEHLHQGLLHREALSASARKDLEAFCGKLANLKPYVFCHRDYHSRNILVKGNDLYLIDFQDARMGPPHYDVASLIFDAYLPIDDKERGRLTQKYLQRLALYPLAKEVSINTFETDMQAVAFQRVVKAAGSFASFYTRYGKSTHLPYLQPALETALDLQKRAPKWLGPLSTVIPLQNWLEEVKSLKLK